METYLTVIENVINNLGSSLIYYVLGILVILVVTILLSLLTIFISARKSAQIKSCKKALKQKSELLLLQETQSKQNIQKLREILSTVEQNFTLQASEQADIDSLEESALWDRQRLALVELTERLNNSEHELLSLKKKNRSAKDYISKLETARMSVFNNLNEASRKVRQLEEYLQIKLQDERDTKQTVAKLEGKNQTYKMAIDKHQLVRLSVFNDLNKASKKSQQLEAQLKAIQFNGQQDSSAETLVNAQEQNQHLQLEIEKLAQSRVEMNDELNLAREKITQLEKDLKNKEDKPTEIVNDEITIEPRQEFAAEALSQSPSFFSKIIGSFNTKQTVTSDVFADNIDDKSGTGIIDATIFAEKDALIDSLKNELAAQKNHIERLQDRLDTKNNSHQDAITLSATDELQKTAPATIDASTKESDMNPQAVMNNMKDQLKTALQKITLFKKN